MFADLRMPTTLDEFLIWEDGTDRRYEFADGAIKAMPIPSGLHGTVKANLIALLHEALCCRRPCRPEASPAMRVSERTMWLADIGVTCRPPEQEIGDPLLIVEIIAPESRDHDLGRKLRDYRTLGSVKAIWMVDSERRWVQIWRRDASGWSVQELSGGAEIVSDLFDSAIGLDEIYRNTEL